MPSFSRRIVLGMAASIAMLAPFVARAQDGSTWDMIQERGALRVGVTQAPPWFYKGPGDAEWTGLGAAIGKDMAEKLDVEFEPVEVTWGTAVPALQADKIDLMFVLDATEERAEAVDFPENPLLYYSLAVLVEDDLTVADWSDLNKDSVKLAVTQGTTMDSFVTEQLPEAGILRFPSNGEAVAAFQSRRVNAVSLFHPPLIAMRKQIGRGQIVVPDPPYQSASSVGVRKQEDHEFLDWVNERVGDYYDSGQTQEWYEEFLTSFDVDPDSVPGTRKAE